ncbi:hypothetical protein CYFUS_003609 [Cystobacter fuscus]|uniref:Uncharacterized protein n=1 Tax=Cystobacter fuscus TaxID=43 RepID=A0A250J4Q5_9BACT|nr:hypothetical protein [Cystobacter fuscus]ATB38176.1 hypothetical protein CYFUS_003609 [Cystobacter fuscus]
MNRRGDQHAEPHHTEGHSENSYLKRHAPRFYLRFHRPGKVTPGRLQCVPAACGDVLAAARELLHLLPPPNGVETVESKGDWLLEVYRDQAYKYEMLSGTESNLARHGRRMAGEFFRMLTF